MLGKLFAHLCEQPVVLRRFDLVCLSQNDLKGDGALVEKRHDLFVDRLDPMTAVYQNKRTAQTGPPGQILLKQSLPFLNDIYRGIGVAIPRKVDKVPFITQRE